MVKGGVKFLAKARGKEMTSDQMKVLNMLKLKQSKLRENHQPFLTELTVINLQISRWNLNESNKITLNSRSDDTNMGEKVRIYHHGQHKQFRKRSSILKLSTPNGLAEIHNACASALESNVASHLLTPAQLDPRAQDILLAEVEVSFTDEDNDKLTAPPTKSEIKSILDLCCAHAA